MLPEVRSRGNNLPVHLPSIWTGMCSLGLHQDNECCGDSAKIVGDHDRHLHWWHPRIYSRGSSIFGSVDSCPIERGVHNQFQEASDVPKTRTEVPENDGEHNYLAHQLASRQAQADSVQGCQDVQHGLSVSLASCRFLNAATQAIPQPHCL